MPRWIAPHLSITLQLIDRKRLLERGRRPFCHAVPDGVVERGRISLVLLADLGERVRVPDVAELQAPGLRLLFYEGYTMHACMHHFIHSRLRLRARRVCEGSTVQKFAGQRTERTHSKVQTRDQ